MRHIFGNLRAMTMAVVLIVIGAMGYHFMSDAVIRGGGGEDLSYDYVRVGVMKHDDGRIEVTVQQQDLRDGSWSDDIRPAARFLSADAESGVWHRSSAAAIEPRPLELANEAAVRSVRSDWLAQDGTEGAFDHLDSFHCLVAHGDPRGDAFWEQLLHRVGYAAQQTFGNVRLRYATDAAEQAEHVRQCVDDGATVIGVTLAAPETMAPAIAYAREAGARVVTFNSGADYAAQLGSAVHIALDDRAAGVVAAEHFQAAGVEGAVVCLVHERQNVGLDERCEGMDEVLDEVRVVNFADAADPVAAISEAIGADGVGGAITLNSTSFGLLLRAVAQSGAEIVAASFGSDLALIGPLLSGQMQFMVWDQSVLQGRIAQALMTEVDFRTWSQIDPTLFYGGARILIQASALDGPGVRALFADFPPEFMQALMQAQGGATEMRDE